jgi:hypothetical protein
MQLALNQQNGEERRQPVHFRIPFLTESTGLGDAISAATSAAGVKPCEPCKERARQLNQRLVFDPWRT